MEIPFRVRISRDQLRAEVELKESLDENLSISVEGLKAFLEEQKVVFGIKQEALLELANDPNKHPYPLVIAEGTPPQHGEDAYLVVEYQREETKQKTKVNYRDVLDIPSVKNGQIIAKTVPQSLGVMGRGVTGKVLPAHDGKPLKIRAGKNVVNDGNQFISTIDGQVSITNKMITVNPVFEVNGDLDLRTGNVNFVGNVVIRGNVPTGYEVAAGGDIKIYGLVEGAQLVARGNIIITGGVTGGNRGKIVANGSIQVNYLNQADIRAGQDVIINTSSLHSNIEAKGSIVCKNGHVIGGILRAGKDIHVKELGNHLFTKTELIVGYDPSIEEKERSLKVEENEISENVKKLDKIESKLIENAKLKGRLTEQEKEIIIKQRATKNQLLQQLSEIHKQYEELEKKKLDRGNDCVYIYDKIFPNTSLAFGKYKRQIQTNHTYVKFFMRNSEIVFEPIG